MEDLKPVMLRAGRDQEIRGGYRDSCRAAGLREIRGCLPNRCRGRHFLEIFFEVPEETLLIARLSPVPKLEEDHVAEHRPAFESHCAHRGAHLWIAVASKSMDPCGGIHKDARHSLPLSHALQLFWGHEIIECAELL